MTTQAAATQDIDPSIQGGVAGQTANPAIRTPLLSKMLLLFMVAMIFANLGGNMYGPLLPLYLKELDAGVLQIGLFFTLSQILPLAMQILGGWISDSLGRLRSIALGSLAGVLSYIGLILAPTWQWVLLGEGFNAVTRSLIGPSFDAFIAEQTREENRARVFGITSTLFMIVSVVGPPLGGYMVDHYGFKWMLICAGGFYLIATIIRIGMARAAAGGAEANPKKLTIDSLRLNLKAIGALVLGGGLITWILITDGVRDVAYNMSFNLLPLYLEEVGGISIQQIGWMNSAFGVAMMVAATPGGWLADKYGERLGIVLGFLLEFIALFFFVRLDTFVGFTLAWGLAGLGAGIINPAYQSLISKAVPNHLRGMAFGLFSSSLGLVSLPAPAIGAQLWTRVNPRFPFLITAYALLFSILPAWKKFKLPGKENAASDA